MHDEEQTTPDQDDQSHQAHQPARVYNTLGRKQAPFSNAARFTNHYNATSNQPGNSSLGCRNSHQGLPYNRSPQALPDFGSYGTNSAPGLSPNSFPTHQSMVIRNSSVLVPSSIQIPCIARSGISCYCDACLAIEVGSTLGKSEIYTGQNPRLGIQNYDFGVEDARTPSYHHSGASKFKQRAFDPHYNHTLSATSQFGPSYTLMPSQYGQSSMNNSFLSALPAGSQEPGSRSTELDFMPQSQSMTYLPGLTKSTGRPYRTNRSRARRSRPVTKSSPTPASTTASLDGVKFLEVQEALHRTFKYGEVPPISSRGDLAQLLKLTREQLDFCINARQEIIPLLYALAVSSAKAGVPASHVAKWIMEIQSSDPKIYSLDSAYQPYDIGDTVENEERPAKRRRRPAIGQTREKLFQCTSKIDDGSYCPQESDNFSDWKRHEETHWPQGRWKCLMQDSNGHVSCHICNGRIDMVGQHQSISHTMCLQRDARPGHIFRRKDKLIQHVREVHECNPDIDSWFYGTPSNWNRQCGFCGSNISDWDARCRHVGMHFGGGESMKADWKDPWPAEDEPSPQPPGDNDDDDHDDGDDVGDGYGGANDYL